MSTATANKPKNTVTTSTSTVDVTRIKPGDLMSFTYYGTVKTVKELKGKNPQITLDNLIGDSFEFGVHGTELIAGGASADQFSSEEKVTKTRAAELLVGAFNQPLTVCFDKQDGTERVLRGRMTSAEPLLGRSHVEDLDVYGSNRMRQVDHRTIKWLVLAGVKYKVV